MQVHGAFCRRGRQVVTTVLKAIGSIRRRVWNAWPWSRWRLVYVEDAPDAPRFGKVYIIGGREYPFQAVMDCPCGCGSPIWLDLVSGGGPYWTAREGRSRVASLKPSVWRADSCHSHFILRDGRVRWC